MDKQQNNRDNFFCHGNKTFKICEITVKYALSIDWRFKWLFFSVSLNFCVQKRKSLLIFHFKYKTYVGMLGIHIIKKLFGVIFWLKHWFLHDIWYLQIVNLRIRYTITRYQIRLRVTWYYLTSKFGYAVKLDI